MYNAYMNNECKTFVFFGTVGSGKGTQIELLEKHLKEKNPNASVLWSYVGGEFRKLVAESNYTGLIVKDRLQKGFLQPNFLSVSMFANSLIRSLDEDTYLLVDGFPRSSSQTHFFEQIMDFYGRKNVALIHIIVSRDEAIRRMKLRNRSDDNDAGMKNRLLDYTNEVLPALLHLQMHEGYSLYEINGEQSVENVFKEIVDKLKI